MELNLPASEIIVPLFNLPIGDTSEPITAVLESLWFKKESFIWYLSSGIIRFRAVFFQERGSFLNLF